jgi:NTE family protein
MLLVYHGGVTTALVLSAGGLFGAWQAGVWKAVAARMPPDIVLGASAGAWNAWAIAGGATPEELAARWRDPRIGEVLRFGPHRTGFLCAEPLHAMARELFEAYRPRMPLAFPLVEVPGLRVRLVRETEVTWRHLAAACSIPFGCPPVEIEGRRYVDGGLRASLPLWAAAEMGADRALAAFCLTNWPFRLLRRLFRPVAVPGSLAVTRVIPPRDLGSVRDALVWSRGNIERWIAQGERDALRALG